MLRGLVGLLAAAVLCAQMADKPLVLVLIGPPASGKTTQADYIFRKYKIPVITVENLLTEPMKRGDPAVNDLVRAEILKIDTARGFVLDGYPATRAQATYLAAMLDEMKFPQPFIVQLNIPDNVVWERSMGQNRAEVERRLAEYHREMEIIRNYYPEASIWTVDGTRSVSGVSQTIRLLVEDR